MGFSTTFLNLLHTVTFLIGAAITSIAIYVLVEGSKYLKLEGADEYDPSGWYAYVPLICGIVLMLCGVIGCCCTKEGNWCFLSLYAILLWIVGLLQIVSGSVIVTAVAKWMKNIANTGNASIGLQEGVGGAQQAFSDFVLGISKGCCPSFTISGCDVNSSSYCYLNARIFNDGEKAVSPNEQFCSLLGDEASICASTEVFIQKSYEMLDANMLPAGIALLVFGTILFLAGFFSCHLGCKSSSSSKSKGQERGAQDIGYGGQNQGMTLA